MHAPDQFENTDPDDGVAVRVTTVNFGNTFAHVEPQFIPTGLDVTTPVPVPDFEIVKVNADCMKLAVTDLNESMVTEHVGPLPAQAPDQPLKLQLPAGEAFRLTMAFFENSKLH